MRNYRDLRVWDEGHKLTLAVYAASRAFPKEERFGLTSQVRRASSSIPANLAEGCGRRSDGEMARFVQIAMGSGAELSYHLLLAKDLGLVDADHYTELNVHLERVMKMLSSFAERLKAARNQDGLKPRANSQEPIASVS